MTDLEAKFTAVETQLAGQHTEIMAALASIGAALGAPPTTPTATMDDLLEAIQMTNSILTTMLTTSNSHLLAIFNTLDTMNNNASLNSQRILNTLLQTSCPCDTTVPLLPPPLGTTPISAESLAHCQRVQYFIDLFAGWAIDVGRYVGEMGSISSFQIDNLLAIHVGDVGITTGQIADPMPTAVRDNIVGQITSAVSASGAESVNTGLFMAMTNPDNLDGMRQALYGEDNADAGRAALDDMLDSLVGMEDPYTSMIRTMFYSAWLNDILAMYRSWMLALMMARCVIRTRRKQDATPIHMYSHRATTHILSLAPSYIRARMRCGWLATIRDIHSRSYLNPHGLR